MSYLQPSASNLGITSPSPEGRTAAEERWVSYQPYLLSKGYNLRPRYRQDWVPSWETNRQNPHDCEDRGDTLVCSQNTIWLFALISSLAQALKVLDATRVEDGRQVVIKLSVPSPDDRRGTEEAEILQRFSYSEFEDNPMNHVVPCLDTFPVPDVPGGTFIVTPLLSKYDYPEFWDLGEVHNFLEQIFDVS